MRQSASIAIALVGAAAAPIPLAAAPIPPIPSSAAALEQRFAGLAPKAVAAARYSFEQPAIRSGMLATSDDLEKAMGQTVARQNPSLSPDKIARLQTIVGDAMKERFDLSMRMNMVNGLDVLSTDDPVALDRFSSTPEDGRILAEMPKLTAALPTMMQSIVPGDVADLHRRMKQNGAELKL